MKPSTNKPRIEGVAFLADGARIELWAIGDGIGEMRGSIFGDMFHRQVRMSRSNDKVQVVEEFARRLGPPRPVGLGAAKMFFANARAYSSKETIEHAAFLRSVLRLSVTLWSENEQV